MLLGDVGAPGRHSQTQTLLHRLAAGRPGVTPGPAPTSCCCTHLIHAACSSPTAQTPMLALHRQRLTPEGRQHALSLMAVGAAATLYHATSGRARRIARKVDYWTIAVSSAAMVKSVYADRCVGGGVV